MPTVKVSVPPIHGAAVAVSYAGDVPVEYKTAGPVEVELEHLDRFLAAVPGSSVVGDPPPPDPSAPSRSGAVGRLIPPETPAPSAKPEAPAKE